VTGWARALVALALVALLAVPPVAATLPAAAGGTAAPAALPTGGTVEGDADEPFSVAVDTLSPTAPRPGDTLVIAGRVTAREPLTDVTVRLRVGRPLTSRSALARADGRLLATSARASPEPVADAVPAGTTRSFQVVVPAAELRLESLGVHPLHVEVRARVALDDDATGGADAAGEVVARTVQTFLPTFPEPVQPTRVALLLPLTRAPVPPAPAGDESGDTGPDGALVEELAPGGRLHGLLEAGAAGSAAGIPVTWVVDPALLDDVQALAGGARAGTPVAAPASGEATATAAAWSDRARAVLPAGTVLALPYADPDVVALVRDGLEDELALAVLQGRQKVAAVLGIAGVEGWAWPPSGLTTPESVQALAATGARRLLLDPTGLQGTEPPRTTPDAATVVEVAGRTLDVVTTDPALTALLSAGPDGPPARPPGADPLGRTLALQRVAAETALLTAERPGSGRAAVLAPPRLWSAEPAYVRQLVTGLVAQAWLRPVALPELLPEAAPPVTADAPPELAEDATRRAAEEALSAAWTAPLVAAGQALEEFRPVLTEPERVMTPRRLALLRAASAAWRNEDLRPAGRQVSATAERSVASLLTAVRVEGGGPVLFTAEAGTIPLTVVNELDQAVVVEVAVDPAGQARLLSGAVSRLQVEPGRRRQVDIQVVARTSGQFPVVVRLRSPTGVPLGAPVRVTVRSTAYGRVAVGITAGAAGVLVVAAAVRLARRALRARPRRV
jgi:hypothetical protein